jgi:LPPG:FO 2-phospho-L-lactate transferase
MTDYRNDSPVALLAGGVGGARMARGLAAVCSNLTIIVNVGDDDTMHGVFVSPDLDTVMYTLAGIEGPQGWGQAGDTFEVMAHVGRLGADNRFRIGDRDLATNLVRTSWLREGLSLSEVTARLAAAFEITVQILPVTDQAVPTRVRSGIEWMTFQEYFVLGGAEDPVDELRYEGADRATPAPGVTTAIESAEMVVIAPSNPPLSVWPMLAIPAVRSAVERAGRVVAVSPLIGGRAVKGPADRVMASLGLPAGNQGVADAYTGLITHLVVDVGDAGESLATPAHIHALETRITAPEAAARLAAELLALP